MHPIIAEDIALHHHNGRGINGVSLSVPAGRCLGVLGENGSGKTTLTRMIAGLEKTRQGRLLVLGQDACPRPTHLRRQCGVALDSPAHWDTLTGRQNLLFFARQYGLRGAELNRRADELLADANLAEQANEPVADYSFGMRRKLSIIETLAHDPQLLILDEPSAGVDTAFLDQLAQWTKHRCQDGKTTWIADNDADWLGRVATDAILLRKGSIKARGNVEELLNSVAAQTTITFRLEEPGFTATPTIDGITAFACEENRITAQATGKPELPAELLAWITAKGARVRSMEVRSMTLHEALVKQAAQKEARP